MKTQLDQNIDPKGILPRLELVLAAPGSDGILNFVRILRENVPHYNWVGVYLVRNEKLVLSEYAGDSATEHVTIPIGQGICGAAAESGETIDVPDVNNDPRYLACFPSTRSEIVVPIFGTAGVVGEIDIDSDKIAAFESRDRKLLERAAEMLGFFLEQQRSVNRTIET